jgi:tetratricopeptide (TPR) repeat protein
MTTSNLNYQELFALSRQRYTRYYLDFLGSHHLDEIGLRQEKNQILQAVRNDLNASIPDYSWVVPISRLLIRMGDYKVGAELLNKVIQIAPDGHKLKAYLFYGTFISKSGNVVKAIAHFEDGCILAEKLNEQEIFAQINVKLGHLLRLIGELEKGENLLLDALDKLFKYQNPQNLYDVYNALGCLYDDKCEYQKAFHYFTLAIKVAEQNNLASGLAATYTNFAVTYANLGQPDNSIECLRECLKTPKPRP